MLQAIPDASTTTTISADSVQDFAVTALDPASSLSITLKYDWTLDGTTLLSTGSTTRYSPRSTDLGPHILRLEATSKLTNLLTSRTWTLMVRPAFPSPGLSYYVAPNGSNSNPGTLAAPFLTFEKARDAIRALKSTSGLPAGGVAVFLRGGTYNRAALGTFDLSSTDSGTTTSPVVYRAFPGEVPVINGGYDVPANLFQPLSGAAQARVSSATLSAQIRELSLASLPSIVNKNSFPTVFADSGNILHVFQNGVRMPIARWPNGTGVANMNGVVWNGGSFYPGDIPGPGPGGKFNYTGTRPSRWTSAISHGLWTKGYWRVSWQADAVKVSAIDTLAQTILHAGIPNLGIGSKYSRPQGSFAEPWWVFNLLEEIDTPGEWCLDFTDNKIYFYPAAPIINGSVQLADLSTPLIRTNNTSHTRFEKLVLETGIGNGVEITQGSRVLLAGCVIRNFSKQAVQISDGFEHGVLSSELYNLGGGGVWMFGGTVATRKRTGHFSINNHIHDFAQIVLVYSAGVKMGDQSVCIGTRAANNDIHDTPHVGILWGSLENRIEYNRIHRFNLVSDDMGAIYRNQYDPAVGPTGRYPAPSRNLIRYNWLHDTPYFKSAGIYFDGDQDYGDISYGNVLRNLGLGIWNNGTLWRHETRNNIAIQCNYMFGFGGGITLQSDIRNNVAIDCMLPFSFVNQHYLGARYSAASDPGFEDATHGNHKLHPDAAIYTHLPEFRDIPFQLIGLFRDDFRTTLGFPTSFPPLPGPPGHATVYVRSDGNDASDGSSWISAKQTLPAGIARCSALGGGDVLIKGGTYLKSPLTTMTLASGVNLKGGYVGVGLTRDPRRYPTILDGGGSRSRTGRRIFTGVNANDFTLDDLTLRNGWEGISHSGDISPGYGGALYLSGCNNVTINRVNIQENYSSNGGALYLTNACSGVTLNDCIIAGNYNSAAQGGGVALGRDCEVTINRCVFIANMSNDEGGALAHFAPRIELNDCIFADNWAVNGGGALYFWSGYSGYARFNRTTFAGNSTNGDGSVMFQENSGNPGDYVNSLFIGNGASGSKRAPGSLMSFTASTGGLGYAAGLYHCTLARNRSAGVLLHNNVRVGTFCTTNTLFAGNQATALAGTSVTQSNNGSYTTNQARFAMDQAGSTSGSALFQAVTALYTPPADASNRALTLWKSELVDNSGHYATNQLAGKIIQPNINALGHAYITSNTATQIFVCGDLDETKTYAPFGNATRGTNMFSMSPGNTYGYRIADYRPLAGSTGIDAAGPVGSGVFGGVTDDFLRAPRPFGAVSDQGAYEVRPDLLLDPVSVHIVRLPTGAGDSTTLLLTNSGELTLGFISFTISGPHASQFRLDNLPTSLAPGASQAIQVRLLGFHTGDNSALLSISTAIGDYLVPLMGYAFPRNGVDSLVWTLY